MSPTIEGSLHNLSVHRFTTMRIWSSSPSGCNSYLLLFHYYFISFCFSCIIEYCIYIIIFFSREEIACNGMHGLRDAQIYDRTLKAYTRILHVNE